LGYRIRGKIVSELLARAKASVVLGFKERELEVDLGLEIDRGND
jgi:hypothetical protein